MSGSTGTQSSVVARAKDARILAAVLKTINFTEETTCTFTESGVKFTVDQAGCVQARAFLQASLFEDYQCTTDDADLTEFRVNFNVFLECLNMFGGLFPVSLIMKYAGYGHPVLLTLEQQGVVIDCTIKTLEPSAPAEIDIRATAIPSNIIMKSAWLAEVFTGLDTTSETITFHLAPDKPFFRIMTHGQAGSMQVDCPKNSDVVESFTCEKTLIFKYKLKLLKPSEHALAASTKISIRVNAWGTLSMQFMLNIEGFDESIFIEFLCLPEDIEASEQEFTQPTQA
eukprot:m.45460 g.45460  ORF g.45460 m.45460 type:complete len:284 (+) comp11015_c0_seq2:46-897(+)